MCGKKSFSIILALVIIAPWVVIKLLALGHVSLLFSIVTTIIGLTKMLSK